MSTLNRVVLKLPIVDTIRAITSLLLWKFRWLVWYMLRRWWPIPGVLSCVIESDLNLIVFVESCSRQGEYSSKPTSDIDLGFKCQLMPLTFVQRGYCKPIRVEYPTIDINLCALHDSSWMKKKAISLGFFSFYLVILWMNWWLVFRGNEQIDCW